VIWNQATIDHLYIQLIVNVWVNTQWSLHNWNQLTSLDVQVIMNPIWSFHNEWYIICQWRFTLFTWTLISKLRTSLATIPPQTNKTKSVPIQGIADNKLVITVAKVSIRTLECLCILTLYLDALVNRKRTYTKPCDL